ncbi:MAG: aspartate aminotransferase family protein [Hyphomicrobium sp.]
MTTAKQKILELNAFDMLAGGGLDPSTAALVSRRRRTFGPTSMLFYKKPLNLVRGEGVWLYDADGSRYLDAYNNVPSIGHCHPGVVAAVAQQMATLNTHTRYLYDIVYTYAERLLATMPADISNIVFTCTGSESVDLALRIARNVTGGTGFIATANAYHGNTTTATAVSPSSANAESSNPDVYFVPAPDTYRHDSDEAGRRLASDVQRAIDAMSARGIRFAGMIADSIFSSDGVHPGVPGLISATVETVRAAGGLYIADEVQPGFARTGDAMWGFARHGIVPDIVVMGKPMGNGYPIGGVAVKPALLDAFGSKSGYFNTFGGSPVAAAAGLAVLDALESEALQASARETGAYLLDQLKSVAAHHEKVGHVRGAGLYLAVEFVEDRASRQPDKDAAVTGVNALRERNVLCGTAGLHGNIWKIRPPLCFNRDHADLFAQGFRDVLSSLD